MLSHASRSELGDEPVAALAVRGKELQLGSTVAAARRLLASRAVKVVPVLRGRRYVGAVDPEALAGAADDGSLGALARDLLPVATAQTPAGEALAALDAHGGTRLVVLEEDASTYVGIVCLRGDRDRLCVDRDRLVGHGRGHGR
jgi:CBS domain-containing protein